MASSYRVSRTQNLELVARLNAEIFDSDLPIEQGVLETSLWWILWHGNEPAGFAGLAPDGKDWQLVRAGVCENHRGKGLQRRLISVRVREAMRRGGRDILTYVSAENVGSMRSLVREGFVPYRHAADSNGVWIYLGRAITQAA